MKMSTHYIDRYERLVESEQSTSADSSNRSQERGAQTNRHPSRSNRALLLILLLVVGGVGLQLFRSQRQAALNHELIVALERYDYARALALVQQGAGPNTRAPRKPALLQIVDEIRRPRWPIVFPSTENPTAFMMACGAGWLDEQDKSKWHLDAPDDAVLVRAMIEHGANLNTRSDGEDALMVAVMWYHPQISALLLAHGANPNTQDNLHFTPLYWIVARALTGKEGSGTIRDLIAHGADPEIADRRGITPLMLAQQAKRQDIVNLLLQTTKK